MLLVTLTLTISQPVFHAIAVLVVILDHVVAGSDQNLALIHALASIHESTVLLLCGQLTSSDHELDTPS